MNKRLVYAIILIVLTFLAVSVPLIKAQTVSNIVINPDGSVTGTNSIQHVGYTYALTANVTGNFEVQKSNIIINGSSYTLNGNGGLGIDLNDPNSYPTISVTNVTIENLYITNCGFGILSNGGGNCTFYDDYLSNCKLDACIMLIGASYNNITYCTIIGSNVTESVGMVEGASYNTIKENNLIGGINIYQSVNETVDRNYWSASTLNSQDEHPLTKSVAIPLTGANTSSNIPEFPLLAVVLSLFIVVSLSCTVLVMTRRRKKDR